MDLVYALPSTYTRAGSSVACPLGTPRASDGRTTVRVASAGSAPARRRRRWAAAAGGLM